MTQITYQATSLRSLVKQMMPSAPLEIPYDGAKEHYILDIEHKNEAINVIKVLLPLIPYPKKRKK